MKQSSLEVTLANLLGRIVVRDESALFELQRVFAGRICDFVLNRIHDQGEAEEVVSDTLYAVWGNAHRFRGDAKPSVWILGIAKNKGLMRLRARPPAAEDIDEMDDVLVDSSPNGFDDAVMRQSRKHVGGCLDTLSDEQRECVTLVFYEGYSLAEIAEIQDCPENTVKTRLFHARKKLKGCLQKFKDML